MSEETSKVCQVCLDQILPVELRIPASIAAIQENPQNGVNTTEGPANGEEIFVVVSKKWQNGRTLKVHFMDGDPQIQKKVIEKANQWSNYANIKFQFGATAEDSQIRISFTPGGSWSYIGTDAISIPKNQPTMNYGWFTSETDDDEYSRVVIHEFGHALGCPHEHSHPTNDIHWNKPVVYQYYAQQGWSKEMVDNNLFAKYNKTLTQYSKFDPESIMLYAIPPQHTTDGFSVGWNKKLSQTDKEFIATVYPK